MKNILLIILSAFIFLGCAHKIETNINPYVTLDQNDKQNSKVNFLGVNDQRDTNIVSIILDEGKIEKEYTVNIDVKKWYTEALTRELENSDMLSNDTTPDIRMLVNVKKISAVYINDTFDTKNLMANIKLELVIKKGDNIITSNIQNKQTLYKALIFDAEDFEEIVNEIMRDSVSKAVSVAIEKIEE